MATIDESLFPRPWAYEVEGFNGGPCVKDAKGQVICAFFWPTHGPEITSEAIDTLIADLAEAFQRAPILMDLAVSLDLAEAVTRENERLTREVQYLNDGAVEAQKLGFLRDGTRICRYRPGAKVKQLVDSKRVIERNGKKVD